MGATSSTRQGPSLSHLNIAIARAGSQMRLSSFYEGARGYLTINNGRGGSAVVEVAGELGAVLADCQVRAQAAPGTSHVIDMGPDGRVMLSPADLAVFLAVGRVALAELQPGRR